MGTHPIFESDFDCLTEKIMRAVGREVNFNSFGSIHDYSKTANSFQSNLCSPLPSLLKSPIRRIPNLSNSFNQNSGNSQSPSEENSSNESAQDEESENEPKSEDLKKNRKSTFFSSWEKYAEEDPGEPFRRRRNFVGQKRKYNIKKRRHITCIKDKLECHRKLRVLPVKYECRYCARTYQMEGTYRRHFISHFDCRHFACEICDTSNRDANEARLHLKDAHENESHDLRCPQCPADKRPFASAHILNEHMKISHPITSALFNCIFCHVRLPLSEMGLIEEHLASHSRLENENNELETLVRLLNDSEHVDSEQSRDAEQSHDAEQDVKEEYIKIEVSD